MRFLSVFVAAALSVALLVMPAPSVARYAVTAGLLQMFSTEGVAQRHCPRDNVVWLNTKTGIYHEAGMRWFGRTKEGAYVCKSEANAAGDRDTRNGQ